MKKLMFVALIIVAMMGLAASGGYYIALPADAIVAHPTTTTGSGLMIAVGGGSNIRSSTWAANDLGIATV